MDIVTEWDVFLSYGSRDKVRARRLKNELVNRGLKVWFDEDQIKAGDSIPLTIEHGIECSRAVIICLSPDFLKKQWTAYEKAAFIYTDPNNTARTLIPVLFRACDLPKTLAHLRYVDYQKHSDNAIDEIFKSLGSEDPDDTFPPNQIKEEKLSILSDLDLDEKAPSVCKSNVECENTIFLEIIKSDKPLSILLQSLFPYCTLNTRVEYFTCLFFDALTDWEYLFNDRRLEKEKKFANLMNDLFYGFIELPYLLRKQVQGKFSYENARNYFTPYFDNKHDDLLVHFQCANDAELLSYFCTTINTIFSDDKFLRVSNNEYDDEISYDIPYITDKNISEWKAFAKSEYRTPSAQSNRFHESNRTALLCGKIDELNCLIEFCNSRIPTQMFSWFSISGKGGTGKSRLARELMEWVKHSHDNWDAVKTEIRTESLIRKVTGFISQGKNVLIVLDYYKWHLGSMTQDFAEIYEACNCAKVQVRLLLVEREPVLEDGSLPWHPSIIHAKFVPKSADKSWITNNGLMQMLPLDDEALIDLMNSYVKGIDTPQEVDEALFLKKISEIGDDLKSPLYVQGIADALLNGKDARDWDDAAILSYVITNEEKYIRENCMGLTDLTDSEKGALWQICNKWSIVATLSGALSWASITEYFKKDYAKLERYTEKKEKDSPRRFLAECLGYSLGEEILPIEPDLIGEFFIVKEFEKLDEEQRMELINIAAKIDPVVYSV
jgi:hypothetical protein